jgi:hypothetical protein
MVLIVWRSTRRVERAYGRKCADDPVYRSSNAAEKPTLRLVALRMSKNRTRAAERLGMGPVLLARWIGRWELLPPMLTCEHAPRALEQELENQ